MVEQTVTLPVDSVSFEDEGTLELPTNIMPPQYETVNQCPQYDTVIPTQYDTQTRGADESDSETTACIIDPPSYETPSILDMDHIPTKTISDSIQGLPSISMTRLNTMPMPYTVDSKSETNSALMSICKICHAGGDSNDPLISPCRCMGTLQYIHGTCLTVSR